nr:hypothetical protein [Mameliella alba]
MGHDDLAKNDLARRTDLDPQVAAAFECDGRFLDPRTGDHLAGCRRQARHFQLIHLGRKPRRRHRHCLDIGAVDDVDGETPGHADVEGGVLETAVGFVLDAQRKDRRIGRQAVEEGIGRRIHHPIGGDCRHPGDGAWHDGPDHDLVGLARGELCKIQRVVYPPVRHWAISLP